MNEFEDSRVHCWLKLYMLSIATSYRIKEENRTFKSEYIISQAIMMACKKLGYDGVAYYSKRVDNELFALCAINLALFADYGKKNSSLEKHMEIDNAFNFFLYTQLANSQKYRDYDLRSVSTGFITNIGGYDRQYPYREISFLNLISFYSQHGQTNLMERQKIKLLGVLLLSRQSVPFFIIRGYTNSDQAVTESKINSLIIRFRDAIYFHTAILEFYIFFCIIKAESSYQRRCHGESRCCCF